MRAILILAAAAVLVAFQSPPRPSAAVVEIGEGVRLNLAGKPAEAVPRFRRAIELAQAESDPLLEGRAHWGLGYAYQAQAMYPEAKPALERAVELFEKTGSKSYLAEALIDLGKSEYHLSLLADARRHYLKALGMYEELGNVTRQADLHYNLTFVTSDLLEREALTRRGLDLARKAGAASTEGSLLHSWSDVLFERGRLAEAMDAVIVAIDRFEAGGNRERQHLAPALVSLGRLQRAHGDHARALDAYRRARQIQEAIGDKYGIIQSLNAMAVAYTYLDRPHDARPLLEQAVTLASGTGSPAIVERVVGGLASHLIDHGEVDRGIEIAERLPRSATTDGHLDYVLARGYAARKQFERAIDHYTRATEWARTWGAADRLPRYLLNRARALDRLGRTEEALADAEEGLATVERVRSAAVPTDAMKRGFGDENQSLFAFTLALLHRHGRSREALEVAERARARAFADLLASSDAWTLPASSTSVAQTAAPANETDRPGQPEIVMRGATPEPTEARGRTGDLASRTSVAPLSAGELIALARRLQSTLVSYWVDTDATYAWVISGSGEIDTVRVEVGETRLAELVTQTWSVEPPQTARGTAADADDEQLAWAPRLRGAGLLSLGEGPRRALRSLDGLLIEPIRRLLPAASGTLLTIIPHGPLFRLSFAALVDARGRYLLERYAVHYAPAGVVLRLTERYVHPPAGSPWNYLLVGDPASLPTLPNGKPLPRLPGTRSEVMRVASLMGRSRATLLLGTSATETEVQRLAGDRRVIHFATHGVLRSDDPLESFLALDTGPIGASSRTDGRLTVREIYRLRLSADLVVLSACRTGLGKVSGDGVAGLARAFVYAGTPSIVATLWDVADEPAARFIPQFYRAIERGTDKARALRDAQLQLLRDLRAGRVTISTDTMTLALREHPVLWASFTLVGEPE
jgi:CHAT domain-containing protein/tetratricopeptide (TPR) repeat protein